MVLDRLMRAVLLIVNLGIIIVPCSCVAPSGVVSVTFDDGPIEGWEQNKGVLSEFDVPGTFYLSRLTDISAAEWQLIEKLALDGHEIGNHGLTHANAVTTVEAIGLDQYLIEEVDGAQDFLESMGYTATTFAYPYGKRNATIDDALVSRFSSIRATTYSSTNTKIVDLESAFCDPEDSTAVVYAVGIDRVYGNTIDDWDRAFKKASRTSAVIVMYGHAITDEAVDQGVSPQMLRDLFQLANEYDLVFRPMSEIGQQR